MATSTIVSIPDWARDYVKQYAQRGYDLWQLPTIEAYSGTVVASQTQNEADGIAALATRGIYGDEVISKATDFADGVIQGDWLLGTKAEFIAALALASGGAISSFASVNSRIGKKAFFVSRPDNSLLAQTLVVGVPALYTGRAEDVYFADNFAKERINQDHALSYGVEMGKHPAIDAEALRKAGLANREYLQNSYILNHKLFIEQQELNVVNLEIFGNVLRALTGSQQTTHTTDPKANKAMGAVGGAVAGAMIGSYFSPIGTAIGFVVGGIAGYLGAG
jgi:hypothetical protein